MAEAGRAGRSDVIPPPESDPGPSIAEDQIGPADRAEKLDSLERESPGAAGGSGLGFPSILLADRFAGWRGGGFAEPEGSPPLARAARGAGAPRAPAGTPADMGNICVKEET